MTEERRLTVGRVRAAHGLRGMVRVEILTDRPDDRFAPGVRLYREESGEPLTIQNAHPDEPGWLVRFVEVGDRSSAEALKDVFLEADVAPGEELARGEYYWHEVIGTPVVAVDGTELGRVEDVYRAGAAEVFLVRGGPYGEFDLPAVRAFIRIFAPKRGEIVVDTDALDLQPPKPPRPRGRLSRRAARSSGDTAGSTATTVASVEPAIAPAAEPGTDAGT